LIEPVDASRGSAYVEPPVDTFCPAVLAFAGTTRDGIRMSKKNPSRRPIHFSMLRSYETADLLTLGNGAAGTAAILAMMSYLRTADDWNVYLALALIPAALALDIADGKVARRRHQNSVFGRELDSLADVVSFGVAPAVLAYGLGMHGSVDTAILIFFVSCGISRLARYNVTAAQLSDAAGKVRYFEGTPIPSSVILVALLAICFYLGRTGDRLPLGEIEIASLRWHPLSLVFFINGSTMISKTLRIPKL
jgi:CDP-diacylglycerol--serine O-phosphatidyltransferase